MALKARIKSVSYTAEGVSESGTATTIDLSISGEVLIVAEYVDSVAPNTIIHTQRFQVAASETNLQIAARVTGFGTKMRASRGRAAELAATTGTLLDIP